MECRVFSPRPHDLFFFFARKTPRPDQHRRSTAILRVYDYILQRALLYYYLFYYLLLFRPWQFECILSATFLFVSCQTRPSALSFTPIIIIIYTIMLFANENWNNPAKFADCLLAFAEMARVTEDDGDDGGGGDDDNDRTTIHDCWAKETVAVCQSQGITTATMLMDRVKANPSSDWLTGVSQATIQSIQKFLVRQSTSLQTNCCNCNWSDRLAFLSSSTNSSSNSDIGDTGEVDEQGNPIVLLQDWRTNTDKVFDVLELFATDMGFTTTATTTTTTLSNFNPNQDNIESSSSATSAHTDWATKQTERFRALGLTTIQDIIIALRDKSTLERLLQALTGSGGSSSTKKSSSKKSSSTTLHATTSSYMTRLTLGALNQFLSCLESDLLQSQNFVSILMEYALVHELSLTRQRQYTQRQYHHHSHQHHTPLSHSSDTTTTTTTTTTTSPHFLITDIPHWAHTIVTDQFQFVMIETAMELLDAIQMGELERRLEEVGGIPPGQRPNRHLQKRFAQFLMPSMQDGYKSLLATTSWTGIEEQRSSATTPQQQQQRQQPPKIPRTIQRKTNNTSYFDSMLIHACPHEAHLVLLEGRNHGHDPLYYTYEQRQQFRNRPFQSRLFLTNHPHHSTTNRNYHPSPARGAADDESRMQGWLRTRFSDQTPPSSSSNLNQWDKYCQVVWQAHGNGWAVNGTLSNILTGFFEMSPAHYVSEACILASALSEGGTKNIAYFDDSCSSKLQHQPQEHPPRGSNGGRRGRRGSKQFNHGTTTTTTTTTQVHVEELQQLCPKVLKIVFRNMAKYRFLSRNFNTYRLAHCLTDGSLNKLPLWIPAFSFFIQLSLLGFLLLELTAERTKYYQNPPSPSRTTILQGWDLIALAVVTSMYSLIQAMHGQANFTSVKQVYQYHLGPYTFWMGLLSLADVFAHRTLPIALVVTGFMLIARQETLLDGVLLASIILFVPQLDKELLKALNLDATSIVPTYLIRKAVDELNELLKPNEYVDERHRERLALRHGGEHIEFSDIFVTNPAVDTSNEASSSSSNGGATFGPHEVIHGHYQWGLAGTVWKPDKVYMARNVITENCLLKEVKWRYRRDHRLALGYLEKLVLVRLDGGTVELTGSDVDMEGIILPSMVPQDSEQFPSSSSNKRQSKKERKKRASKKQKQEEVWDGVVQGIFIVTQFEMKQSITKLRICGSNRPATHKSYNMAVAKNNFRRAVEYYSLWDLDSSAVAILSSEDSIVTNGCGTTIGRWVRDSIMIRA
jgi:hypothetical protein